MRGALGGWLGNGRCLGCRDAGSWAARAWPLLGLRVGACMHGLVLRESARVYSWIKQGACLQGRAAWCWLEKQQISVAQHSWLCIVHGSEHVQWLHHFFSLHAQVRFVGLLAL